jgi:hypothetical protein
MKACRASCFQTEVTRGAAQPCVRRPLRTTFSGRACALGEVSEVQKLAARHHQISETEQRSDCSTWTGDHLQQQLGRRPFGNENVGHDGSHDLCGQMLSSCDRDNAPRRPSHRRGEGVTHARIGQGDNLLWRPTPEVVEPVIGVGRQPNLPHPRPHLLRTRPDGHSAPCLHRGIRHHCVARVGSTRLRLSDSPSVANHARHRSTTVAGSLRIDARQRYRWRWIQARIAFEWASTVPSGSRNAGSLTSPVASRTASRVPVRRKGKGLP